MNRRLATRWAPALIAMLVLALGPALRATAANLALGKTCFATWNNAVTGNGGANTTANAVDNDYGTQWDNTAVSGGSASPSAPLDKIGVDLGAVVSFRYLRIAWAGDRATAFTVDVCDDVDMDPNSFNYGESISNSWVTVFTRDPAATPPKNPEGLSFDVNRDFIDLWKDNNLTSLNHRYVRISGTKSSNTNNLWGVKEFQVLDAPLGSIGGAVTAGGSPVGSALLSISGPTDTGNPAPFSTSSITADAGGLYIFNGLDAGTYTVTASKPGKFAQSQFPGIVVGASGTVPLNVTLTAPVNNVTASMPAYNLDYIAGPTNLVGAANANANSLALPADELPAGNAIWTAATPLPTGGTVGPNLSPDLKFFFPPTADGFNNAVSAQNAVIPFPSAHYTSLYILQVSGDQNFYTTATLNYSDGSSSVVTTPSGNAVYGFHTGTSAPTEDEVTAITVDKLYNVNSGATDTAAGDVPYSVFVRSIRVDSTKALTSLQFGDIQSGPGSGTISKGYILGYSADTIDTPQARGSISGTIKSPSGAPVPNALVQFLSYSVTTGSSGTYTFNGIPAITATITASKPANYAPKSATITLTAGQNATLDIQFLAPVPVVTDPLSSPNWDMVSTNANFSDFTATGWMLGREYIPTGLFSPDVPGSNTFSATTFTQNNGAPSALPFDFGDIVDTAITAGGAGFPAGGTPCGVVLQGAQFLAPPTQISNVYFVECGIEGSCNVAATLHYADGTSEQKIAAVSDWFGSPTSNELPYLIMHGRHSRSGESNVGGSINLNALKIAVDPTKQLKDVSFYEASQPGVYPSVLALAWETATQQPASSDIEVVVKNADNTPAVGAIVNLGFYNTKANANGVAVFKGIPAGLTIGVGAFMPGVTKQARVDGHLVPSGKKYSATGTDNADIINLTLNGGAPINDALQIAFDFDLLANAEMPGDSCSIPTFNHQDTAFDESGLSFPSNSTVTNYPGLGSMIFNTPHREVGFNNVLRQNGQTATVAPGHYSSLTIVDTGAGVGGDHPTLFYVTFNYADGTSEQVQYTTQDWVLNFTSQDAANLNLFYRTYWAGSSNNPFYSATRRKWDGSTDGAAVAPLANVLPVNAGKVLTSFTLVPIVRGIGDNDQEIFAATLEANDHIVTPGTLSGTVTGQAAGAASVGPIAGAMVYLDSFHGVYTDASGNFTLTNVPTGPVTLNVLPYGTGILTKSMPVTVVSGANNLGTIALGAAVTQISCVLGATNTDNGLHQIAGWSTPYGLQVGDGVTSPVKIQGITARETQTNGTYIYFRLDKGWLYRGKMGTQGLTVLNPGTPTQTIPKLAPDIYVQIQYFDRGTDTFRIQYNTMAKATVNGFDTYQFLNSKEYVNGTGTIGTGGQTYVTKTGTNTWKTFTYHLDPTLADDAFGAWDGQNGFADFRFSGRGDGLPEDVHSIVLSTTPNIIPPVSPAGTADILRVYGGLQAAPAAASSLWPTYDLNGDGVVNFKDAIKSAKP